MHSCQSLAKTSMPSVIAQNQNSLQAECQAPGLQALEYVRAASITVWV